MEKGYPKENLNKKFLQLVIQQKKVGVGTGLGLAISQKDN